MIWLDWYCRMHANTFVPAEERMDDPRRDLAMSAWIYFATYLREDPKLLRPRPIDFHWYSALTPFVVPFLPPEAARPGAVPPPEPLGLVLTRPTAALLAGAKPPIDDKPWISALEGRTVYIDVPHGAARIGETLQLRAIFLRKMQSSGPEQFVAIGVVTDRGSEQGVGRMVAVLRAVDGKVLPALDEGGNPLTELDLLPPFTEEGTEQFAREQTADFLRLTLAYHLFGPRDVQERVSTTPTNRLNQGKPRKDESLFAMVRLQPARDRLGRPVEPNATSGWSLTTQQEVTGHFKLQPHGPGSALRKMIWVAPYNRGPEGASTKPHAYRI
ncbi:MAG TPA: hypothetical protein VME47_21990 [Acetobacteraceae bacterium]|nr:hypothetical protein [Acetobacteraceae bacterium]